MKAELRRCIVFIPVKEEIKQGFFHGWGLEKDSDKSYTVGIVEWTNGYVAMIPPEQIQFFKKPMSQEEYANQVSADKDLKINLLSNLNSYMEGFLNENKLWDKFEQYKFEIIRNS